MKEKISPSSVSLELSKSFFIRTSMSRNLSTISGFQIWEKTSSKYARSFWRCPLCYSSGNCLICTNLFSWAWDQGDEFTLYCFQLYPPFWLPTWWIPSLRFGVAWLSAVCEFQLWIEKLMPAFLYSHDFFIELSRLYFAWILQKALFNLLEFSWKYLLAVAGKPRQVSSNPGSFLPMREKFLSIKQILLWVILYICLK